MGQHSEALVAHKRNQLRDVIVQILCRVGGGGEDGAAGAHGGGVEADGARQVRAVEVKGAELGDQIVVNRSPLLRGDLLAIDALGAAEAPQRVLGELRAPIVRPREAHQPRELADAALVRRVLQRLKEPAVGAHVAHDGAIDLVRADAGRQLPVREDGERAVIGGAHRFVAAQQVH